MGMGGGGGIGGMAGGGERNYQAEIPKARYSDLGGVDSCLQVWLSLFFV